MKLRIATPTELVVQCDDVASLRAEDASGGFGIQPGHEDCLTVLTVSMITWRDGKGQRAACAVRGGVLSVRAGERISVSAREAVASADIDLLEHTVLREMRQSADLEKHTKVESLHLQLHAIRHIVQLMQNGRTPAGWNDQ